MRTENITDEQLANLCSQIAELTDNNNHTEAIKIVCGFLGYEDLHCVLCEIERLHDKAGHISYELICVRKSVYDRLMKNLYSDYCMLVYESIKKSF
jgi:hypothetical protein